MNLKHFYILLAIAILFNSCAKDDRPTVVNIHQGWEFKQQTDTTWNSATVPGNVYSDLLAHNKIPDPFIGSNELNVQWVPTKNWEYQTTLNLDEKTLEKSHIELTFEGLDTYATIYLNDSLLGKTDNAFRTWKFNIKNLAKANNSLRIEFQKTSTHEEKEAAKLDYVLPPGARVFTRKAQFQYGWDWGPIINTSGIWKPIKITSWNNMRLQDVHFKQETLTDSLAQLSVLYTISSDEAVEETSFEIKYDNTTHTVKSPVKKGTHTYATNLQIKNPQRWWTHNLGEPYLYNFDITLKEGKHLKAQQTAKIGLRTIKLIREKDEKGETFYFKLNGIPVFMKGANYIPQHSMQDKVTDAHYEKLLNDVVDANMNMLRVWGGGIYENDIFYELCDEKGILVWQDFMFACAMYPGDKAFLKNIEQEAIDQVKRLRNHASIALWCGNNENNEAWHRWGWQADKTEAQKEEIWNSYLAVFDRILPKTVAKLNPEIDYWESSPSYGRGDKRFQFEGDAHDWGVWHDAYPFERFEEKVPRFMSEFGFQSFPSYEAIRMFTQEDSISINHDSYITHQKHPRGFKLIREYMERDYPVPTSGDDYVYMSQLTQAKGMTLGMEAQRRAMPYCMGSLYWQLNDCWPVVSWSSIDFIGNWKALHYKAKKSFEDVLISSVVENDTIKTYIVSDKLAPLKGDFFLDFVDFNGKNIHNVQQRLTIAPNTSQLVARTPVAHIKIAPSAYVMRGTFTSNSSSSSDSISNTTSSLFYVTRPKDLKLSPQDVSTEVTKTETGFTIELSAKTLQKDVFLYTKAKGHFSDNFFDILPNQTITITFKTEASAIDDLAIKTLNGIQEKLSL
ncbi:glycoside hydrolase family 2 protein [Kordia algicida OT-1]|uniref:Beta-mannosidase B n=1 Tax=Kordia algicida OT-1 TaxID=391587 RepID=A9DYP3_9FLAO|nr:glycoside hydrolase family 2 protein [Kordia algicida]EDP96160.1 beta-mannosidase precursor [Kordia algicida OT-1]